MNLKENTLRSQELESVCDKVYSFFQHVPPNAHGLHKVLEKTVDIVAGFDLDKVASRHGINEAAKRQTDLVARLVRREPTQANRFCVDLPYLRSLVNEFAEILDAAVTLSPTERIQFINYFERLVERFKKRVTGWDMLYYFTRFYSRSELDDGELYDFCKALDLQSVYLWLAHSVETATPAVNGSYGQRRHPMAGRSNGAAARIWLAKSNIIKALHPSERFNQEDWVFYKYLRQDAGSQMMERSSWPQQYLFESITDLTSSAAVQVAKECFEHKKSELEEKLSQVFPVDYFRQVILQHNRKIIWVKYPGSSNRNKDNSLEQKRMLQLKKIAQEFAITPGDGEWSAEEAAFLLEFLRPKTRDFTTISLQEDIELARSGFYLLDENCWYTVLFRDKNEFETRIATAGIKKISFQKREDIISVRLAIGSRDFSFQLNPQLEVVSGLDQLSSETAAWVQWFAVKYIKGVRNRDIYKYRVNESSGSGRMRNSSTVIDGQSHLRVLPFGHVSNKIGELDEQSEWQAKVVENGFQYNLERINTEFLQLQALHPDDRQHYLAQLPESLALIQRRLLQHLEHKVSASDHTRWEGIRRKVIDSLASQHARPTVLPSTNFATVTFVYSPPRKSIDLYIEDVAHELFESS